MSNAVLRRTLVRLAPAFAAHGDISKSVGYELISQGLFPKPVKAGTVSPMVPSDELQAVIDARIAGLSDDKIRALVQRLHAARSTGGVLSLIEPQRTTGNRVQS